MRLSPVGLRPVEADLVPQQQLRQPMPGTHQIPAQILAGANEVTQRLFLDARDRHPVQFAGRQQPDQPLGVAAIGLDAITRPARNQAGRTDQTVDTDRFQLAREPSLPSSDETVLVRELLNL